MAQLTLNCAFGVLLTLGVATASSCVSQEEHRELLTEVAKLKEGYKEIVELLKHSNAKRFLLDGDLDIETEVIKLYNEVEALKADRGSTYVRWGRTVCPANSTAVYRGYTGSNWFTDTAGPANYVCLPEDPTWAKYLDGHQSESNQIFGTEYEDQTESTFNPFSGHMDDEDAPCVVCRAPRQSTIMIPARTSCYKGWHLEYTGYLMATARRDTSSSEYICVDTDAETIPHGAVNHNGGLLYVIEAACGALACPPYVEGRELACVVCSK